MKYGLLFEQSQSVQIEATILQKEKLHIDYLFMPLRPMLLSY